MRQHTNSDQLTIFSFDCLPFDRLAHGIFSRRGGVSDRFGGGLNLSSAVADDPEAVRENRRRAYGTFGRGVDTLVHAHLVHEAGTAVVDGRDHGQVLPACDALLTADPGCGLTMNYADCAPIIIYDPIHHAVGLGHAGWRGTIADVPGAMVRGMAKAFGSRPADLAAAIGPCIGPDQYEVGPEVVAAVQARYGPQAAALLPRRPDQPRHHFDLVAANRLNLRRSGVASIELAGLCTAERTDLFFSHRAEHGQTGRFGAVVILKSWADPAGGGSAQRPPEGSPQSRR